MDTVGGTLLVANQLYARANTTTTASPTKEKPASYKIIGLILAIASGLFIGVSFVLKKHGLLKANVKYNEEAGEGYGYLKNFWWWSGMTLMIMGEICNFAAYLFADAILVTPLGALSVVICAILSSWFLKERLSFVGKIGCFQCIVGAVVIAANAPEQSAVNNIQDMRHLVIHPLFLTYTGVIIIGCAITAFWAGPRWGKKTMMVYITICSLIGGLSVVCIQGIGAAITAQARGQSQFKEWFLYVLLVFVIATLVTEIIFLNKALNLFNAALVTPTYYVMFTSATIISSAFLFRGFKGTPIQILTVVLGFLTICSGVVLLQLSKSSKDVPDAAVFKGDLDQVRTVAEQAEPEYEPRADSIRAGGALLRSISKARHSRQMDEIKQIHEEHHLSMEPLRENEQIEFDGLRRRRTIIASGHGPSPLQQMHRRSSVHPPLGMSQFPDEDGHNSDEDVHPGFLDHIWKRRVSKPLPRTPTGEQVPMSPIKPATPLPDEDRSRSRSPQSTHVYGLPPGLQQDHYADTSYKSPASPHIQFVSGDRPPSRAANSLSPPPAVPPHNAKRQFSFTNVFRRPGSSGGTGAEGSTRPVSRGGLSFSGRQKSGPGGSDGTTEEERMGLVKGDSSTALHRRSESPPEYSDPEDEWQMAGNSPPGNATGPLDVQQTSLPQYSAVSEQRPGQTSGQRRRADTEDAAGSDPPSKEGPAFI